MELSDVRLVSALHSLDCTCSVRILVMTLDEDGLVSHGGINPVTYVPPTSLSPTLAHNRSYSVSTWMLRPATSRLLLATLPRVHVRFLATTLPLEQDRGSRPPRSDPSSNDAGGGIEHAQSIIRRWSEQKSITFRQRTDSLVALIAASFTRLGGEINRVTGYDEIEALKRQVVSQGTSWSTLCPSSAWGTQIHRGSHFCL